MSSERVTRNMELRKLTDHQMHLLAVHLNGCRNWSTLMMIIPKELKDVDLDTITPNFKYTTVHIGMVEKASQTGRPPKMPGHILLEEWSTSGRIRPTVDHLIKLLVRANLFRAADYLAEILQEERPTRPLNGPAAAIDIELSFDDNSEVSRLQTVNSSSAALYQSGVPNVSLFGGMHVIEETHVETTASRLDISSLSTVNLPAAETSGESLPQLSLFMNPTAVSLSSL